MPSKTHPGAREFLLLFPYYERGTVWDAIVKASENGPPWPYPEPTALRVFLDACCGINAMHSQGYAHRDMKARESSCVCARVCCHRFCVCVKQPPLSVVVCASVTCCSSMCLAVLRFRNFDCATAVSG